MRVWLKPQARAASMIGRLAHGQRARAHHARAARDERDGDGDDHVLDAGAEDRHHRQRQDDERKRHQHVHDALEDQIEAAAEIGAGHAEDQARWWRRRRRRRSRPAARCGRRRRCGCRGRGRTGRCRASSSMLGAVEHVAEVVGGGIVHGDLARRTTAIAIIDDHDQSAGSAERVLRAELPQQAPARWRVPARESAAGAPGCEMVAMRGPVSGHSGCADRATHR